MKGNRLERINSELKKEIATIIAQDLRDPQIDTMLSVTSVDCTPNLENAKVYISCFDDKKAKETLNRIKGAGSFIRTKLAPRIQLRIVPHLDFYLDNSIQYGTKIESILSNIKYTTNPEDTFGEE